MASPIPPTVGRVMLYRPNNRDNIDCREGQPLCAHVAAVNDDATVNVSVLDVHGRAVPRSNVLVRQADDPIPQGAAYCEWMEYQKGQAAKYEALEAALPQETRTTKGRK